MDEILTEKRLTILETKLDTIGEKVTEISDELRQHAIWEESKYAQMDAKYSGKWVEKAAIGMLITIAAGMALLVFELIIKK
jgi:hypothetical protein